MPHRFDLVVFDIGGVLVQAVQTWVEAAQRAGFSFSPSRLQQFEAKLRTLPRRGVGAIDSERYYALFAEASDGLFTPDDARRISDASLIAEYPGISCVFDALDAAGMPTAVLTNSNDAAWRRLFPVLPTESEFPSLARIPSRFASHLMGVQEPDPRAFREVERGTGYSADAILFFDDRTENVEAARWFGWTAELIDPAGDTTEQIIRLLRSHGVIDKT
jgi:FMN phosphatase YigB (HAD superfamily)